MKIASPPSHGGARTPANSPTKNPTPATPNGRDSTTGCTRTRMTKPPAVAKSPPTTASAPMADVFTPAQRSALEAGTFSLCPAVAAMVACAP